MCTPFGNTWAGLADPTHSLTPLELVRKLCGLLLQCSLRLHVWTCLRLFLSYQSEELLTECKESLDPIS